MAENKVDASELAFKVASDYVSEKGISHGLNGKQQAGILNRWADEAAELSKLERFEGFLYLGNASALRQRLEKKNLLKAAPKVEENYL